MKGVAMENPTLSTYFKNEKEWENYISQFNVRKIINKNEKAFIQKMKRYYKTYGFGMILYPDQKLRMDLILSQLNNKVYKPGDKIRDGIATYGRLPDSENNMTLEDGSVVKLKTDKEGHFYYEKDGQKYYLIWA